MTSDFHSFDFMPKSCPSESRMQKCVIPPRSPCPLACALDLFGDRWTLLIIRDLMLGRNRFKDFANSPEGIPTNILSERLNRLMAQRVVEQVPAAEGGKRKIYHLTEKGRSMAPLLGLIRDWGLEWLPGTHAQLSQSTPPS
jgi:DNA-binding HxlR family transcriptional regulator